MQTTYKTYYSFCVAQFACGVFLMWLGYRIDLHFLTLRPTDVPLIELYESHVTPLMCSAALRARNRSWIAHEHFVVEKDFMSLKACYVLTCGLASCIAVIFFNSSSEPDSEEDTDDRLKPLWDIAFGFFIVLHSLTFGALSTGALAVFEQYLFLSLGHAVTIIIICTVPRESVMVLGGGFLYAAVMWTGYAQNCTQNMAIFTFAQTCADLLLFIGHRYDQTVTDEIVRKCRLLYVTCSCALMHAWLILN